MRLKTKFTAYILFSILLGIALLIIYSVQHRERVYFLALEGLTQELSWKIFDLNYLTYDYLIMPSERNRAQWLQVHEDLASLLGRNRERLTFDGNFLEKTYFNLGVLQDNFAKLDGLKKNGADLNRETVDDLRAQYASQLLISTRVLYGQAARLSNIINHKALENYQREDWYIISLIIISAIMFYGIIFNVSRVVFPGLKKLAGGFAEISHGNLDFRLKAGADDEIGSLVRYFNKTVAELAEITVSRANLENEIRGRQMSQKRQAALEEAMANSPSPLLMFAGQDFSVSYANRSAGVILGYESQILSTKHLEDIVKGVKAGDVLNRTGKTAVGDAWQNFEADLIRSDGEQIPVEASLHYIQGDEDMNGGFYILSARDITDDKNLEMQQQMLQQDLEKKIQERTHELSRRVAESEQLNRAMINLLEDLQSTNRQLEAMTKQLIDINRELESFSYSVSHDLRAPLRHMSGFVHLLENHAGSSIDEKGQHYIDIISKSSAKLGILIDDLLRYSRTGRTDINLKMIDNNLLLKEIINEIGPPVEDRRIDWEIEELPPVHADRALIKIVWMNLLDNALKFTSGRDPASIKVGSLTDANGAIVYFVKDNGAGFDMKYQDKLFGVFQRLHRESEYPGTGIGLATVQRIIHRHFGRVWAEGAVGHGATVFFSLPKEEIN